MDLQQYGFLGPLVGIGGTLLAAGAALTLGWSRTLDEWKPPASVMPKPLGRVVALGSAVGVCVVWILAEPGNRSGYLRVAGMLFLGALVAFLVYVGLRQYCGRYSKPLMAGGKPSDKTEQIWGGFWKTKAARKSKAVLQDFLAGNKYQPDAAWPPSSLTCSAIVTALTLIVILVGGTLSLATAAAAVQVALTGKPARAVLSPSEVPGLPPSPGGQ